MRREVDDHNNREEKPNLEYKNKLMWFQMYLHLRLWFIFSDYCRYLIFKWYTQKKTVPKQYLTTRSLYLENIYFRQGMSIYRQL